MKKFITIAAVAAFAFFGAVNTSSAQTSQQALEAQIQALLAQLAALQTGGTTTVSSSQYVHQATLRAGMKGPGVSTLQAALNSVQTMQVAVDGSFGPATASAVKQFQAAQGLTADGIVGAKTGAALQAATATVITVPTGNLPAGCTSTAGYSSTTGVKCDSGAGTLPAGCTTASGYSSTTGEKCEVTTGEFPSTGGSEASLEKYKMVGEDDAEEGTMKHVATIEFDVEDGDVKIERLDLTFDNNNSASHKVSGSADLRPWDVFRTVTFKADGKTIGSADLDRRSDWNRDSNPFVFRVTGLDYVVKKGDLAEIEVYLTANSTVRDYANAKWAVYVGNNGIRGVDTAGLTQEIGNSNSSNVVLFSVNKKGGDEDLKIKASSKDPVSTSLKIEGNKKSDWYNVFTYRLEAKENDIDLEKLTIDFTVGSADYNKVVNDVKVKVDGREFKRADVSIDGTCSNTTYTRQNACVDAGSTWTVTNAKKASLEFDIDQRATIDADSMEDVEVWVEFKQRNTSSPYNYSNGETIVASAVSAEGEGVDYVTATGPITGKTHSLNVIGFTISDVKATVTEGGATAGIIDFTFKVTADDEDVTVMPADVVETFGGTATTAQSADIQKVSGDATVVGTTPGIGYKVLAGNTATLRVRYNVTGTAGQTAEVRLDTVLGQEIDVLSPTLILKA